MKRVRSNLRLGLIRTSLMLLALASPLQAAELKFAAVFSDHMVLQREKLLPIWGWADSNERVTVKFAGQKITATADTHGKWLVKLDPMPASAEARTLVVQSEMPERKIEVADVLVGEVWLGSGQSNMVRPVADAMNFEKEQAAANLPAIRMFRVENAGGAIQQAEARGQWSVCSPETVGSYSATLFFFGRELNAALGVPVGLINSSVNSSPIEAWIGAESQTQAPEMKANFDGRTNSGAPLEKDQAKARSEKEPTRSKEQKTQAGEANRPTPDMSLNQVRWRTLRFAPSGLFNGMIAPLIPYAIRGVVWYQGERNTRPGTGSLYQYQLPVLVSDWRSRWGEELPFAWVQLPNYNPAGEDWMLVREAQLKTLRLPHTGMIVTVDIGESNDVHPKNKQDVGRRLALWALGEVYNQKVTATSGPLLKAHEIHGPWHI